MDAGPGGHGRGLRQGAAGGPVWAARH